MSTFKATDKKKKRKMMYLRPHHEELLTLYW